MKITFINPNLSGVIGQNIGLAYVISATEKHYKVDLIDLTFNARRYKKIILRKIENFKPDVIGFSANSFTFPSSLQIASFIRAIYPKIQFIWGGVHPTLLPEETMHNSIVDAICIGEGERALPEYLDKLDKGYEPEVEGIWYKDRNGRVIKNRLRPFEEHLDSLVFPNWDYWDIERYLKEELFFLGGLRHLASRGCPYNCTFCSNEALRNAIPGIYYRRRSPANVIQEIEINVEKYRNKGLKSIFLSDEIFGTNKDWLKEFCQLYIQGGLNTKIAWACTTRADILTEDWAIMASKAGCIMVSLGMESGDGHIRMEVYKKVITEEQIMNSVRYLKDNGIVCHISLIIGGPEENKETVRKSIVLAKKIKPLATQYIFYQPLPKTELQKAIKKESIIKYDSYEYLNLPVISTPYLKKESLSKIKKIIEWERLSNFFLQGRRQEGLKFFLRLIKYLFSLGNMKKVFSGNIHAMTHLEQKILLAYVLENWERERVKRN